MKLSIGKLFYSSYKPLTVEQLLEHPYYGLMRQWSSNLDSLEGYTEFSTKIMQDYFRIVYKTEEDTGFKFIKSTPYHDMNPFELQIALSNYITSMISEERKNCLAYGIPPEYVNIMGIEIGTPVEQIFDDIKLIFAIKTFNHHKYNGYKLWLTMNGAIHKWKRINKKMIRHNENVCAQLHKNIKYQGLSIDI